MQTGQCKHLLSNEAFLTSPGYLSKPGGRHPLHPGFALGDNAVTNDAGLAGSLSYMPLEDIWIGLHGSVSRDLTSTNRKDGFLDGIDAMLGLTASYRIQF